jgi:streptogramin lyase
MSFARPAFAARATLPAVVLATGLVLLSATPGTSAPRVHRREPGLPRIQVIPISGGAADVAVGARAVWVAGDDSLARVDPHREKVVARLQLHGWVGGLAVGAGSVWAATTVPHHYAGRVWRIDPKTNRVLARIPIASGLTGGLGGLAFGAGSIWATSDDYHHSAPLWRIDPTTNRVVARISVGDGPAGVIVAGGFVWVSRITAGTVAEIDPKVNKVVRSIHVGAAPFGLIAGQDSLWVLNENDATVSRIDLRTGAVSRRAIRIGGEYATDIGLASGAIWISRAQKGMLLRFSARTGNLDARLRLPGAFAIAAGFGALWVSENSGKKLARIGL